jgi:hypothetical protein
MGELEMGMNVYIAASIWHYDEMLKRRQDLRDAGLGINVTSGWLDRGPYGDDAYDYRKLPKGSDEQRRFRRAARSDYDDILRSDLLLCFTGQPADKPHTHGRSFECGLAVGAEIDVVVVGKPESLFQLQNFFDMTTVDHFDEWLSAYKLVTERAALWLKMAR